MICSLSDERKYMNDNTHGMRRCGMMKRMSDSSQGMRCCDMMKRMSDTAHGMRRCDMMPILEWHLIRVSSTMWRPIIVCHLPQGSGTTTTTEWHHMMCPAAPSICMHSEISERAGLCVVYVSDQVAEAASPL